MIFWGLFPTYEIENQHGWVHWCTVRRFCCWEGQRWDSKQAVKLRVSALSLMLSLRRRATGPSALHIWKIVFSLAKCLRERGSFGSWILSCLLNFLRCKFFKLLKTITSQSQCSVRRPPTVLWSVLVSTLVTSHSSQFGLIWASVVPSETRVKHRVTEAG